MNILIINNKLSLGGVESYVVELANELSKKHSVFLANIGGDNLKKLSPRITHNYNFSIFYNKYNKYIIPFIAYIILFPLSLIQLLLLVKRNNIQIIHAHNPGPILIANLIKKMLKIPYVITCHSTIKNYDLPSNIAINPDCMILVSEEVQKKILQENNYLSKYPRKVIPNPINSKKFRSEQKGKGKAFFTRFHHDKLPELKYALQDKQIHLYADGPLAKNFVSQNIHKGTIEVPQKMDEYRTIYGVGRVIIEACLMNKEPIIISHKKNKLIKIMVTKDNFKALSKANFSGRGHPTKPIKKTNKTQNLRSLAMKFDSHKIVNSIEQVYKKII